MNMFKIANAFNRIYLQDQIYGLERKHSDIYTRLGEAQTKRNEVSNKLSDAKNELAQARGRYNDLKEIIERKNLQVDSVRREIELLQNTIRGLSDKMDHEDNNFWNAEMALTVANTHLEENANSIADWQRRIDELQSQLLNTPKQKSPYSSIAHIFTDDGTETHAYFPDGSHKVFKGWVNGLLDSGSDNSQDIQKQLENAKEHLRQLQIKRSRELESPRHTARMDEDAAKSRKQAFQQELDNNRAEIRRKEAYLAQVRNEIRQLYADQMKDEQRISSLETYIATLSSELENVELTTATLEHQGVEVDVELQNLRNRIALLPPDDGRSQQVKEREMINELAAKEVAQESASAAGQQAAPPPPITTARLEELARKMLAAEQEHLGNMAAGLGGAISSAGRKTYDTVAGAAAAAAGVYDSFGFIMGAISHGINQVTSDNPQPPPSRTWNPFAPKDDD